METPAGSVSWNSSFCLSTGIQPPLRHLVRSILRPGRWMLIYHINPFCASPLFPSLGGEPRLTFHPSCNGVEYSVLWKLASRFSNHVALGFHSGTLCRATCWDTMHGQPFNATVYHPTFSSANTFSSQLQGWVQTREKPSYSNKESFYPPKIKRNVSPLHLPSNPTSFPNHPHCTSPVKQCF